MNSEPTSLYGLHDSGGEQLFLDAGVQGWIVFNEYIGLDRADNSGVDYSAWSDRGFGVIVKLQHAFNPGGTLPEPIKYEQFAERCARFVSVSEGCRIWVIGNEMNYWPSRPGAYAKTYVPLLADIEDPAEMQAILRSLPERFEALHRSSHSSNTVARGNAITPDRYSACYQKCRQAILDVQADGKVLVGAVTPWNTQTRYAGNEEGDWVTYLKDILLRLGPHGCDGIALHAFTVEADPQAVTRDEWLTGNFQNRRRGFRTYQDFMLGIPYHMRHLPIYLVECDQFEGWPDHSSGWVQRVYAEIDEWNQREGNQQIRALALYRWAQSPGDRWRLSERPGVVQDLKQALQHQYQWNPSRVPLTDPDNPEKRTSLVPGMVVQTLGILNLRAIPGYVGVSADHLVAKLPLNQQCLLADGPVLMDSLIWWRVHTTDAEQQPIEGWVTQAGVDGRPHLERIMGAPDLSEPFEPAPILDDDSMAPGTYFLLLQDVQLRHTPGTQAKDTSDIVRDIPADTPGLVLEGPQFVEDGIWWRVRCAFPPNSQTHGWLQEVVEADQRNLQVIAMPGTPPLPTPNFQKGDTVYALRQVFLRRLPGLESTAPDAIVMQLAAGLSMTIEAGPKYEDKLIWWQVVTLNDTEPVLRGWVAESTTTGYDLVGKESPQLPELDQHPFQPSNDVYVVAESEIRRTPGLEQKAGYDVLGKVARNTLCRILGGPQDVSNLMWWQVTTTSLTKERIWGWISLTNADGALQLAEDPLPVQIAPVPAREPTTRERDIFAVDDTLMNVSPDLIRVRVSPGNVGKPSEDILARVPRRSVLQIQGGPQMVDGLRWWQVLIRFPETPQPEGWVADSTRGGIRVLVYDFLADHIHVAKPFAGFFPLSQAWGSNPDYYQRFHYDGVKLKGHNGFDFAMPEGTPLLATDAGKVHRVGFNAGGLGKYVLLEHAWGESVYAHMNEIPVAVGDILPRGGHLGLSGNTGGSTGPHLHFGIRIVPYRRSDGWGGYCNPAPFMNVDEIFRERPVPMPPSPIGDEQDTLP